MDGEENLRRLKEWVEKTCETLLDVRVLEEILEHSHLIPEEWKKGVTYFWGTIFRGSVGRRGVAGLVWSGERWDWYCYWLEHGWCSFEPATVLRK